MSSIQERLQLKRVPLDTWNIREQLCLASAVVRSGDQNWMSVSRALKTVGEPNRPADWYSQKSCAAQYGVLLEHVETPKRKKRSSEGAVETPQESIVKRLTQERIVEIQKTLAEMNQQYEHMKNEIAEARNPATSEERLREIWSNIEASKRARERETARRAAAMKEREERRARAERQWRPPSTPTSPAASTTPSSPLLTSLLKSSPVVTTPQHITHPANVVDTMSPSVTAPTLSMLLEKSSPQHESKHAAIEHIKSQLVQIEHQLKASSTTSTPVSTPLPAAPAPAVDLDDIEIKAEDVYAFRDIDIHIPPVGNMPKSGNRSNEKQAKPEDDAHIEIVDDREEETAKEEHITVEEVVEDTHIEIETEPTDETVVPTVQQEEVPETEEVKISFPEVKFPTTEIKVIQPDEQKIKEETKEPEQEQPQEEAKVEEVVEEEVIHEEVTREEVPPEEVTNEEICEEPSSVPETTQAEEEVTTSESIEYTQETINDINPETIPLPPEENKEEIKIDPPLPPEPEEKPPEPETKEEKPEPEPEPEDAQTSNVEVTLTDQTTDDTKEDAEDSIPLKQMIRDENNRVDAKEDRVAEETHTETDDDTPMELSREEEKDGKKKRDYSRKKKPDSRTCSGSESAAEASAPESPSATDADRKHRMWKKSVMLVYSRLCAHKYASLFLRPISDEEAPGYSAVVKRPLDLTTIRKNIENGVIRTTAEFQRDVLLMLSNALMYNSSEHSVYTMAKELHEEAACQLGMLLAAQAHAGLEEPPARKRRRNDTTAANKRTQPQNRL